MKMCGELPRNVQDRSSAQQSLKGFDHIQGITEMQTCTAKTPEALNYYRRFGIVLGLPES